MPALAAVLLILRSARAARAQQTRMVPVTVDGERVRLAMRLYQPMTAPPGPPLVFNHGSIGTGTNPDAFTRSLDFPEVARFFVARGWAVVIPARRGRGGSEGQYDEGFSTNRSHGYACDPVLSVAGANRGLRDIEAAMGEGRDQLRRWLERRAVPARAHHQPVALRSGRARSREHGSMAMGTDSIRCHTAARILPRFRPVGGRGVFHELSRDAGGHYIWRRPDQWALLVETYLKRRGLPSEKS